MDIKCKKVKYSKNAFILEVIDIIKSFFPDIRDNTSLHYCGLDGQGGKMYVYCVSENLITALRASL